MNKIFKKKTDTLLIILFFFRNMLLLQTYKKPTTLQLKIMKKNRTKLRVRYGETDQMGVVYYGAYAEYLPALKEHLIAVPLLGAAAVENGGRLQRLLEELLRPRQRCCVLTRFVLL